MKLLERTENLEQLRTGFHQVLSGQGQSIFISGEAGIGKTALVRQFLRELDSPFLLMEGYCDSLFAARPLGPLFDIASHLGSDFERLLKENPNRNQIFPAAFEALDAQAKPVVLVFEDIHWADEATLDFIRFLSRRIKQVPCLFILTLRDNELSPSHPYLRLLGELPPTDFQKLVLTPLSRATVDALAEEAGRSGEEIYRLTAGIPYYVREVLANYHRGIPETVRDSVLSLFHRQFDATKGLWEMLSVIPGRIELEILNKIYTSLSKVVDFCFRAGIVIDDGYAISFKHDLFRSIIEESLSPSRKRELHKAVVDAMLAVTEIEVPTARIIHHARLANDMQSLKELAPKAAEEAAALGSHLEAAKFYKLALEHSADYSPEQRVDLYERYSYECYLTNQIEESIQALEAAIQYLPVTSTLRKGNTFRFLSRLHWFAGDITKATELGMKAIALCEPKANSRELAMAYSNMSQLMMLSDKRKSCLSWGEKAIDLATTLDDHEVLCHAYNNIGASLLHDPATMKEGEKLLRDSQGIALKFQYHEHAARAFTNLGYAYVDLRNFPAAESILREGIAYCDERDLHSWMYYMQGGLANVFLETGRWHESETLCLKLLQNPRQQVIVMITLQSVMCRILMRRGDESSITYMQAVTEAATRMGQLQYLVIAAKLLLEYEWLNNIDPGYHELLKKCTADLQESKDPCFLPEISFWMWKGKKVLPEHFLSEKVMEENHIDLKALQYLAQIKGGNPYLEAIWLIEGGAADQRQALLQFKALGAQRTAERVEAQMRSQGIRHIPRGPRSSTSENSAGLTSRQMQVLALLSEGLQNKEIAGRLFLSVKTIDHHISAILSKLDVNTRSRAIAKAKEIGMLD